jgi:hypothetical protein
MYRYFMSSLEMLLEHYHQFSYVETAYSMTRGKLGDAFRARAT